MAHDLGVIYPLLVVVSGGISGLVFLLSIGVVYRRRGVPYLLIAVALAGLAARSGVAAAEIIGILTFHLHHTLEHALDGLIAVSLIAAIVSMGRPGDDRHGEIDNG